MSMDADWSRTCEGCEYIQLVPWPKKGNCCENVPAFCCFAPGPCRGYHMGTERLLPYIPAWCPKKNALAGGQHTT